MKLERILITCGGTGGHFYPGLAIARAMQKQNGKVLLVLSGINAHAQCEIARQQDIPAVELPAMPHPFSAPWGFFRGMTSGFFSSCREIRRFRPQAVLGMGSFASIPPVLATWILRVPLFLHDGNAKVGKANRWFSLLAKALGTGFPPINSSRIKCRTVHVGMPIRQSLLDAAEKTDKKQAIEELNRRYQTDLSADVPTILIFGGSQGAAAFNAALPEALLQLNRNDLQVLHLTGKGKLDSTLSIYKDAAFKKLVVDSSEQMELFWLAADMVFSRSGGSSIAELALFGRPAVLVPYPFAAENHQKANAQYFSNSGAGLIVDNFELTPDKGKELLEDFLNNPAIWQERGNAAKRLAMPTAAEDMLDLIARSI